MKHVLVFCFVLFTLSLTGCNENNIKQLNQITSNIVFTIDENREQINLSEEYIYYFGKSKEEIIKNLGNDFIEEFTKNTEPNEKESNWYISTSLIKYKDIEILIYNTEYGESVRRIIIRRKNQQYVGNIAIGKSINNVLEQLGNPNEISANGNSIIYNENNYYLSFTIANNTVESIYIVEHL